MRHLFLVSTMPVVLAALMVTTATWAAEPATFPFVVSYDAPDNVVNVSHMLDAPAGKHGFVRVKDGKFVTDAGEIRFWATNLSVRGNFPDKEHADRLAARLARFGFNCVRLHHLDSVAIWGDKGDRPATQRKIDPKMIDKLDYLVAALKKRGIYVNMNLHVGRWLDDRDGFPHKNLRPEYDKGLDNFEPRMIELQKEYARDLLTHVTGFIENSGMKFEKYADDETDRRTLHQNWGDAPVLCEDVPMVVTLHGKKSARCYALDTAGNRREECPVTVEAKGVRLALEPKHRTLWYEIELAP